MRTRVRRDAGLYKSVVWVQALVGVLARHGIDLALLFEGSDLQPSLLRDSRVRISLSQWRTLVLRAMQLTHDPGLGLTIGSTAPESIHQIVGQIAAVCGSWREATRMFERYQPLLGNTNRFDLVEEGERAYLMFTPLYPAAEAPQFDAEMALALIYRLARRYTRREDDDAQEVWFAHAAPDYVKRYAEVFRCPVGFGRRWNAILFDRKYLDEPLIYANPLLLDALRDSAERMLAQQGSPSLPDRVRAMLLHEVDLRSVNASRVAKALKIAPRSLQRKLSRANASWSLLLDEARCRIACDELRRSDVSIRELTERLGFSDQSAFNRAFKRWTGTTPARYAHDSGVQAPTTIAVFGRCRTSKRPRPSTSEGDGGE